MTEALARIKSELQASQRAASNEAPVGERLGILVWEMDQLAALANLLEHEGLDENALSERVLAAARGEWPEE
jgi:hypothetical protein